MRVWPVADGAITNNIAAIEGADARHIVTVLRRRPGDRLKVSDPASRVYTARITEADKNRVVVAIEAEATPTAKKPDVTLALSVCKPQVMELVVQKAVELGCKTVVPLVTRRSLADTLSTAKLTRLKKIAHEASKQCGRPDPVSISDPAGPDELPDATLKIVLWEEEKETAIDDLLKEETVPDSAALAIGPPGGFDGGEIETFRQLGFSTAGMGGLILRTETAAIALLSVVNFRYGKFRP